MQETFGIMQEIVLNLNPQHSGVSKTALRKTYTNYIQTRILLIVLLVMLPVAFCSPPLKQVEETSFPERLGTHPVFPILPIELTMALVSLCSVLAYCAISLVVIGAFSVLFFWFLVYKIIHRIGEFARERVDSSGNFIAARYDRATAYWSGAYEDIIAFTKPRVDSWLWWYKASVITKMATSVFKCYVGAFGSPFGGQGSFESACQTVRMCPEGKHDKSSKTPFSYVHGLLMTAGILGYAFYGRVPTKIKEALWVHGAIPNMWDLYSNISGHFFNWFSVGHVNGCTCTICELERDAMPEGMDASEWSKLFKEMPPADRPTVIKSKIPRDEQKFDADGNEVTERDFDPRGIYPTEEIRHFELHGKRMTMDEYAEFVNGLKGRNTPAEKAIHMPENPPYGLGNTLRDTYDCARRWIQDPGTRVVVTREKCVLNEPHISTSFVSAGVLPLSDKGNVAEIPEEEKVIQAISNIENAAVSDESGSSTGVGSLEDAERVLLTDESLVSDIYNQKNLSSRFHIFFSWSLSKICGPFKVMSFRQKPECAVSGFLSQDPTQDASYCPVELPTALIQTYPHVDVEVTPELYAPRGYEHVETVQTQSPTYNWYAKNAKLICNTLEVVVYASIYAAFAFGAYKLSKSLQNRPGTIVMPAEEVKAFVKTDVEQKGLAKRTLALGVAGMIAKPAIKMFLHGSSRVAKFVVNGSEYNVYDYDSNNVAINGKTEIPMKDDSFIRWIDNSMSHLAGKFTFTARTPDGKLVQTDVVKLKDQHKQRARDRKPANFSKLDKTMRKEARRDAAPPKCHYCGNKHHHTDGCKIELEAFRATQRQFYAKFSPEALQGVRTRIDMKKISDRLFKMYCSVGSELLFKCNGFLFGEKLVTVKHGFEDIDGKPFGGAFGQSGLNSSILPAYIDVPEAGGDLIYFPMKGKCSPMGRVALESPKNGEPVFLIAYDHEGDQLPSITHGTINEQGYHSCPSIPGNCAGVLVNENGAVVGFHQAGSKQVNKCIPCTPAVIKSLQAGF